MYKYNELVRSRKRQQGFLNAIGDLFLFVFPIFAYDLLKPFFTFDDEKFEKIFFLIGIICTIFYIIYLIWRIWTIYKVSNEKKDIYRAEIMNQVDSVMCNKYNMLCKETHYSVYQNNDLLLYNAHDVVNDILVHIKQLIANITGLPLENISVDFIYKYHGLNEHWQTIDGSSSCSIGNLDDIVQETSSTYHYLYANDLEYVFYNNKADAEWHKYKPSIRDGEDKSTWGSIYCKRIICSMHQNRIVDGILSIATYNEKFTNVKRKAAIKEIENLINESVVAFSNPIKIEMTSLYIRHENNKRKQCNAIEVLLAEKILSENEQQLYKIRPQEMTEEMRKEILDSVLPKCQKKYMKKYSLFLKNKDILDALTEVMWPNYTAQKTKYYLKNVPHVKSVKGIKILKK